jgi:3-hydroxymyristoyl/3-hydroxydecanoyl-(acyl carrier protein) dehydratase
MADTNLTKDFIASLEEQNSSYADFLKSRKEGLQQITDLINFELDLTENSPVLPQKTDPPKEKPAVAVTSIQDDLIWNEEQLLEFAKGRIANVFGSRYSQIDNYTPRVRLPMPPYLLVSRVTKLKAKLHEYKPSTITTEYDIPIDSWYSTDGRIPWSVAVESGQCDLLLISYLGVDFANRGERVYRLLDCTLTYMDDLPQEGETLRYDISINSFAKSGDILLFFFSYDCYVKDKLFLKMTGGCAGFFTMAELDAGKGVIYTDKQIKERSSAIRKTVSPLLASTKSEFDLNDLQEMTLGNFEVISREHQQHTNSSLVVEGGKMLMIDQISSIDTTGGAWGLGSMTAKLDLYAEAWYFPCHFKDDEVMAGSLMAEACVQLLQFYLIYIGAHKITQDAIFQPIPNLPQKVICRGQVIPGDQRLIYKTVIRKLGLGTVPHAIADIEIWLEDRIVVLFENLGVQLKER